jgi:hypothetical protein
LPGWTTDRQQYLFEYGTALGRLDNDHAKRLFRPKDWIRWQDATQVAEEIDRHLVSHANELRSFLLGRNIAELRGLRLQIHAEIYDHRSQSRQQLPPRDVVLD